MSEMSDAERAKEIRAEMMMVLAACACEYPLTRYRNMSGHASDCPADAAWRRLHIENRKDPADES
jgi:hypothetical protein